MFNHSIISNQESQYPRLIFIHTPELPYSIISFWLRAGSRFESDKKAGLAHLLEHTLMKKTKKFAKVTKRFEYMEQKGIFYSAFTSQDLVYYYCIQEPKEIVNAFNLLLDGFQNSLINKKDVEAQKNTVLDEQQRQLNDQSSQIWKLANKGLWWGYTLAHDVLGDKKTLTDITLDDLKQFKKRYYTPERLNVVVLSSSLKDYPKIEDKLKVLKTSTRESFTKQEAYKPKDYIIEKKERDSVLLAVSFLTKGNKTLYDAAVLHYIREYLAGGWISKLIQRLRVEKSLTYWVNGYLRDFSDTGFLKFVFSTQRKNLKEALKIVLEEIGKIKRGGILQKDIDKYKEIVKLRLLRSLTNDIELLRYYGWNSQVYKHGLILPKDYLNILDNLDPKSILSVAQDQLENSSIAAVGSLIEKELIV